MSGELIRSVVTLNIIVSWKPNDGQIISFHHAVKVFSIVVERRAVHHIGAQSLDKPWLENGNSTIAPQIIVTNISVWKTLPLSIIVFVLLFSSSVSSLSSVPSVV